jgi:hypothetical protein
VLPCLAPLVVAFTLALAACGGDIADEPAEVDAESYRVEIEALDALVFSHSLLNEGRRNVISMAFSDLADKMAHIDRSYGATTRGRAFRRLSEQVRQDSLSQASLRGQWQRLRNDVFSYAEWFRYVDPSTGRELARPPRPADLAAAERVLEDLEKLIAEAYRDLSELGAISADRHSGRPGRAHLESWKEWIESWPEAVDEVMQGMPEEPGDGVNLTYRMAHARLGYAADYLKAAVSTNWLLPFQAAEEQQFAGAQIHLDSAREALRSLAASGD